jgi:hypothetical protein
MSLAIALVPSVLVLNETALAPRVTDTELGISEAEFVEWFLDVASAADLCFHHSRTNILSDELARNNPTNAKKFGQTWEFTTRCRRKHMCRSARYISRTSPYFSHLTALHQVV